MDLPNAPIPMALFSCSNEDCERERSYPANELYWHDRDQAWFCEECLGFLDDDGEDNRLTLEEFIKLTDPSISDLLKGESTE